jgi:glycosyltransferase involved in cell wall biosynthesis
MSANTSDREATGVRTRSGAERPHFIYLAETDLSVDNGPGINEREFVDAATRHWPDEIAVVAPAPLHPETYLNPAVHYVASHARRATAYPHYLISAVRTVRRIAAEHETAAIAFRFGVTPLVPFLFSRMQGPHVLLKTFAPHDALGPQMKLGPVRSALNRILSPAYRSVVRSALAADTVSGAYRDWICSRYEIPPERIAVVPNGVNTDMFTLGDGRRGRRSLGLEGCDRVVGYVGALNAIRYLDLLIRCVIRLQGEARTALVLVGDGPERASLEALARDLGVADRVVFVGSVPYAAVPEYVRAFDVAVDLTSVEMSIEGRTVLSSFSQKIPQYLACGVPVVAWHCGDTEFLIKEDVGRTATFRDEAELIGALQRILDSSLEERRQRRSGARALVKARFSAVRVAEQRLEWWRTSVARSSEDASGSEA